MLSIDLLSFFLLQYTKIISDEYKGVMTPPVLVDVNNDNIEDIIIPLYNSTLFAFDGQTFEQLWNRTFASSETYRFEAKQFFFLFLFN